MLEVMERVGVDFVMVMKIHNEILDTLLFLVQALEVIQVVEQIEGEFVEFAVIQVQDIDVRVLEIDALDSEETRRS